MKPAEHQKDFGVLKHAALSATVLVLIVVLNLVNFIFTERSHKKFVVTMLLFRRWVLELEGFIY